MQKIIKLETENTSLERWTENSACEIYSHDTNNGHFEIEVMNEALTDETVTALFIFEESQSVWRTTGTIEENKIKFKFDTTLITQDETVLCVLYLDNERENNDFYRFNFKVKVSEIDKLDNLTVKERFFKNNLIVDRLDVVTKTELQEILKTIDLSNISTDGLLTEDKANGLYAKISELEALERQIPSVSTFITEETLRTTKNDVVTEINNQLKDYALKTNIPEPYNDTNLVNRVSDLEQKQDKDTVYDDSELKARISVLESREDNNTIYDDTSVRERLTVLENKPNVDISNLATKDELNEVRNNQPTLDTSNLVTKNELEDKHYLTTHQDLSEYAKKSELYNDSDLKARVEVLEQKTDKDTVYDDKPIKDRLDVLENKVDNDTIYNDTEVKHRLTELENKPAVDTSVFVTDEKLSNYALKSELPTPYNDSPLNERVTALESKAIEGGAYNDTELRNRVTELENKPPLDISNFVTNQVLESKNYITEEILNNKGFAKTSEIPAPYNDSEVKERLTVLENKQDKDTIYNDTELRTRVSELEQRPIATPYNDTVLNDRVTALENKQDNDTVYNDTPIKERLTALESKPNIDLTDYETFKNMVVTKGYLEKQKFLTEQYNDKPLTDRVVALENKTTTNQFEIHGTGMPNGVVTAEIGTTYVDKNKTNGALKWIKTTNGGNQGWEVLTGDTGWRTLNSISKLTVDGRTSTIKIRRVNNLVTYQFGGLQWGWFGIVRRDGAGHVGHGSSGDRGAKVLGVGGIPYGFRSEASLVGGTYDDRGRPYGVWYLGGLDDSNYMQFTFNDPIPTDRDIGDIRVSAVSYLTAEPWPTQLP